jgi:hypothetical protein
MGAGHPSRGSRRCLGLGACHLGALIVMISAGCAASPAASTSPADDAGTVSPDVDAGPPMPPPPVLDSGQPKPDASPPPEDSAVADAPPEADVLSGADAGSPARWYGFYGDGAYEDGRSVAVDGAGNVLYAGYFQGMVTFGTTPLVASGMSSDIFVAKFDATGTHVWSERFGDNNVQVATGVAVDAAGDVFVTGINMGTVDFGLGAPLTSAGAEDVFLVKLDPTGRALWAKDLGDPASQLAYGVAVDAAGNVAIVGSFEGTMDLGNGPLASAGLYDIYVAKFDTNGTALWSKRFGDASNQFGAFIAADATGNLAFTGSIEGATDFGAGALTSAGMKDAFVTKLDPTGQLVFAKRYGNPADQLGDCVAFDPMGDAIVSGGMQGTVDFGAGPLIAVADGGKFLIKLDATGATAWSQVLGDGDVYDWTAVAVDRSGNATVAGEFWNSIVIGGKVLQSTDRYDIFVAKFDPAGQSRWAYRFGAAGDQYARTLATDTNGNIAMAGYFLGKLGFTPGGGMNAPFNGLLYLVDLAP